MNNENWEDRIIAEQESVLRSIQDIVQSMQDDYIDSNRIKELEEYIKTLKTLEEEFEVRTDAEIIDEERMMQEEDELERIRAIESTQA